MCCCGTAWIRMRDKHGTFTMSPSFTHRARDAPFYVPFRRSLQSSCARAPIAAPQDMQYPFCPRAVPRTFTTSPGFTPSAHGAHSCIQVGCRPQALCARAPIAARRGMQRHSLRARGSAYVHHVPELHAVSPGLYRTLPACSVMTVRGKRGLHMCERGSRKEGATQCIARALTNRRGATYPSYCWRVGSLTTRWCSSW